jgi:Mg2+ and Co2+ transporter CorA
MGEKKPLWKEIEALSEKKRKERLKTHQRNLENFKDASKTYLNSIRKLEREIKKIEDEIIQSLKAEDTASALGLMLGLRRLRIELLIERSALSIARANRCYNQTILSVIEGVSVGVKYDSTSVRKLIPKEMKEAVDASIKATNFNDILRKYRKQIDAFLTDDDSVDEATTEEVEQ